ncbi:unnamed protein product [Ectocarpus sp. CCAP 1310/34]|nr:unnamed protein product [Ectocarpus sp. CCAP 1310/34]
MSGGKVVLDIVHKAAVVSLLASTAYGTYFVSSAVMELRRMGQDAAKNQEAKAPAKTQ